MRGKPIFWYLACALNIAAFTVLVASLVSPGGQWLEPRAAREPVPMGTALAILGYLLMNAVVTYQAIERKDRDQ